VADHYRRAEDRTGGKTSVSSQTITSVEMLPDGTARITLKAAPATAYQLQATTSLVSPPGWAIGANTTDATGMCAFIDQDAASYPSRFYRTVAVKLRAAVDSVSIPKSKSSAPSQTRSTAPLLTFLPRRMNLPNLKA